MSQLIYERVRMALGILKAIKDDHQVERVMPPVSKNPKTLEEWAGSQHLSLGLVFTDNRNWNEAWRRKVGLTISSRISQWAENLPRGLTPTL